ncbi:helix-turn-helix domain-containing protein [Vibrio sp. SCSIO 43135]|uniref:AraC family transcriptional regulator n=1 Tax=Vibrio paucivorans TaxID=2829489 RepID=A0A9X3CGK6_9VIBR|nr:MULTISPECIES: AraC family transcriptional regulator [Vibrio]MCW8335453.1 AraC family transcriptional regulator [Vibrio paucivorans]USD43098.1 helix-turn-helix domain-containing protein [Vibrio sp. SCSIO 43135]
MRNKHFIRAIGFVNMYQQVCKKYRINPDQLSLAPSVFRSPMTLIPVSELNLLFRELETLSGDPDYIINMITELKMFELGAIGRWMFSGHDLASTIRRINYGSSCLQSGAYMAGSQVGSIVKWTYSNPFVESDVKIHDSARVAAFMLNVMRIHLGEAFTPMRVMLSGTRKNKQAYNEYFGCEIGWNHNRTELWFHSDLRLATKQHELVPKQKLAMSFQDLDEFLNLPQSEDEMKVIYEVINYSCHYGLPTLNRVASLLGLSEQQFQRRLHKQGLNFTTICGYVMSNAAVNLLAESVPINEVAQRLGYSNVESFNRMFKKHRGVTPSQYIQRFQGYF